MEDTHNCTAGDGSCNDNTQETDFNEEDYSDSAMIFHGTVISICGLFGLIGNCIVLTLFIARRRLRSIGNLYILQRSVADVLSHITTPFFIVTAIKEAFIFGPVLCRILSILVQISILASAMFLAVMAIDCYICIRRKFHSATFRSTMFKITSSVIWVICAILAIPIGFLTSYTDVGPTAHCLEVPLFYHYEPIARIMCIEIVFVVPFVLTWVFIWMSFPAKTSTPALPSDGDPEEEHEEDAKNPRRLVLALAILYTLCQLPFWVTEFVITVAPTSMHLFYATVSLIDINTAINPLLYLVYNRDLKQEFMILLPSRATTTVPLERLH